MSLLQSHIEKMGLQFPECAEVSNGAFSSESLPLFVVYVIKKVQKKKFSIWACGELFWPALYTNQLYGSAPP